VHFDVLRCLAPISAIVVPLEARGRTVGAIALATTTDSGRHYGAADLELATALAGRAALLVDNARLYSEAKAAIDARDQMIAVVSHDLRNPLQSIATAAALLKIDPTPDRRTRSLQSIAVATAQMKRLLQDLLDISSMDAGEFSVTLETVAVASLIDEARTLCQPVADGKSIRLDCAVPADVPVVVADRSRILQVLSNLLGNALKFTPDGGLVRLEVSRLGDAVRFAVADDGPGIPPEHQSRIFQRFWRANPEKRSGAGLGLAVAKGILSAHGAEIRVDSAEGRGSTFHFDLRIAAAAVEDFPTQRSIGPTLAAGS
jgi:signal transduction histidine kinase